MNKTKTLVLFIPIIIGFVSCSKKKIDRDEAIQFYAHMFFIKQRITRSGNDAIYMYNDIKAFSRENNDESIGDSISNLMSTEIKRHIEVIDSAAQALGNVNEADKEFKVIESMTLYLNKEKEFWNTTMTDAVEFMRIGLKNLNDEQSMILQAFKDDGDKIEEESKKINNIIANFGEKYKIKKGDLKRLNLIPG